MIPSLSLPSFSAETISPRIALSAERNATLAEGSSHRHATAEPVSSANADAARTATSAGRPLLSNTQASESAGALYLPKDRFDLKVSTIASRSLPRGQRVHFLAC